MGEGVDLGGCKQACMYVNMRMNEVKSQSKGHVLDMGLIRTYLTLSCFSMPHAEV